jgi:aminopeptidase N
VGAAAEWEDTRPAAWLTNKEMTVQTDSAASSLLLVNKLGTGYYRVNYDSATWARIAAQLLEDHQAVHPLQRATIVCDVVSLADFGVVSEATRDAVLAYREREETFGPLLAFKECVNSRGGQDAEREKDVVY